MRLHDIICVHADNDSLYEISFDGRTPPANVIECEAYRQIDEYLDGKRKDFDIPLKLCGTEFQLSVWKALCEIPYGNTASYIDIAKRIGKPTAQRAVGMANKNRIPIIIPCHRVIFADGSIGGYSCGTDIKRKLLEIERKNSH